MFSRKHFEKEFGEQATHIARVANHIIDQYGIVLTGRYYMDGTCLGFSTTQEETDTHVAVAIGLEVMGKLPSVEEPIHQDLPDVEDENRALRSRLAQMERAKERK